MWVISGVFVSPVVSELEGLSKGAVEDERERGKRGEAVMTGAK